MFRSMTAMVLAAGLGTRMAPGQVTPNAAKQFQSLAGVPILIHSLRA